MERRALSANASKEGAWLPNCAALRNSVVAVVKKRHHRAAWHGFNFRSTDSANRGGTALGRAALFHALAYAVLAAGLDRAGAAVAGILPFVTRRNAIPLRHRCSHRTNEQFRLLQDGFGLGGNCGTRAPASARMGLPHQLHARYRTQVESLADGLRVSVGLGWARYVDLGFLAAQHVRQPCLHADECLTGHSNRLAHGNTRCCFCDNSLRFDSRAGFVSDESKSAAGAGLWCAAIDLDGGGRVRGGAPNKKSSGDSEDGDRLGRDR